MRSRGAAGNATWGCDTAVANTGSERLAKNPAAALVVVALRNWRRVNLSLLIDWYHTRPYDPRLDY